MSMNRQHGGGTVERVLQLHNSLKKLDVDSHILTLHDSAETIELSKNEVTGLTCLSKRWFIPAPNLIKIWLQVKRSDAVHMINNWTLLNVWTYIMCRLQRKPYFYCPAGALTIYGRSRFFKRLYRCLIGREILKRAKKVIAISKSEIEQFRHEGIAVDKIIELPNGIAVDEFLVSEPELFRSYHKIPDRPFILFLGRLNPIKGPDLLLEAFKSIEHRLSYDLVIAGPDGGMLEELQAYAAENQLSERVHFVGSLKGDMKSSAYHGASLFVIPSRHEAMSIVALEAACCKVPVLMTNICGFPSLETVGAAKQVDVSSKSIAAGIVGLLSEPGLKQRGIKGYEYVVSNYPWDRVASRLLSEFKNSLSGSTSDS